MLYDLFVLLCPSKPVTKLCKTVWKTDLRERRCAMALLFELFFILSSGLSDNTTASIPINIRDGSYGSLRNGPIVVHNIIQFCPQRTLNALRMTAHSQDIIYKNIKRDRFCNIYNVLSSFASDPCHIVEKLDSIKEINRINTNTSYLISGYYLTHSKLMDVDSATGLQAIAFNLRSLRWNLISTPEWVVILFNATGIQNVLSRSRSLVSIDIADVLHLLQYSKYYDEFGHLWVYNDEWQEIMSRVTTKYDKIAFLIFFLYLFPWVPFMSAYIVGRNGMLYSEQRCLWMFLVVFGYPIIVYLSRKYVYQCLLSQA